MGDVDIELLNFSVVLLLFLLFEFVLLLIFCDEASPYVSVFILTQEVEDLVTNVCSRATSGDDCVEGPPPAGVISE